MKNFSLFLCYLLVALPWIQSFSQTAEIQVIHNSPDPAAAIVDVYLDSTILLDDFAFRSATPFTEVPAETEFEVGIALGNSAGPEDIVATFPFTLPEGGQFIVVATGVLDPSTFNTTVNDSIGFTLVAAGGQSTGTDSPNVDVLVYHGSTDAPAVDVLVGTTVLVDSISYGSFDTYFPAPNAALTLDVAPAGGSPIASFDADLTGLAGGAAVILASGFLDPTTNQDGEAFTLIAVLPDGTVLDLGAEPAAPTAEVQIIHNSPDPAASIVDIYLDSVILLDDFSFREATPFTEVPADTTIEVGIALGNSAGPEDIVATFEFNLPENSQSIVVATGVLDPTNFNTMANDSIGFTLAAAGGQSMGTDSPNVDVLVYHGSTDAPAVDVLAGTTVLVDSLPYGSFDGYFPAPNAEITLGIAPAGDTAIASFDADLTGLAGGAAVILASGFLDPSTNQNGDAFTLIVVLPDGTVLDLSSPTSIDPSLLLTGLKLYPNPTTNRITIEATDLSQKPLQIELYDMVGRNINTQQIQPVNGRVKQEISLNNTLPGTYLLKATQGEKISVSRIIIQ